jgi:hypothetical protein
VKIPIGNQSAEELRAFCGNAALQMADLETRLRAIVASGEPETALLVLEETVGTSLQIAKALLDAGQRGHHGTLFSLRPLLRALAATRL